MEEQGNFDNCREVGEWKYWYENGKLKSAGKYNNAEKTGTWVEYSEDGQLLKETKF